MPVYQLWVCNNDYTRKLLLANSGSERTWSKMSYTQTVNGVDTCSIDLVPNSSRIEQLALMDRLLIYRDGVIVFGGILLREDWGIDADAPSGDTYTLNALGLGVYADWRLIVPGTGEAHDERTGAADDVAKAYVRAHASAGAAVARQIADLSVQADAGDAASLTEQARYKILLSTLKELADKGGFDWRFVPSATGVEFQTAYPRWGVDRTKGNGVNDECVFSLDRRNFLSLRYTRDLLSHTNYVYVGGQGEGTDRAIEERSDATAITAYKRRERLINATQLTLAASLQARGDAALQELKPVEAINLIPRADTWKTLWDLGDDITVYVVRYGRVFDQDFNIPAVSVEVVPPGYEIVKPDLEALS